MKQVLFFSITAMANPTLVAVTTVMLVLPDPRRLMLGYLCGALLMSIGVGLVLVFTVQLSGAASTAKHTVDPLLDLVVGTILLLLAFVVRTGRHKRLTRRREERRRRRDASQAPRWQRALDRGTPRIAFVVGALLTLPGASYLAALAGIIKLDSAPVPTVLLVVLVNVIMLALIEVPLLAYAFAPEWTPGAIERTKAWLARRGERIVFLGLVGVGALLVLRGVVTLAT